MRDKKLMPDPVGSYLLPTHHKVLCNLLSICVRLDDAAWLDSYAGCLSTLRSGDYEMPG